MKILITGGAGFIGSKLIDPLVNGGNEVFVVDDLSTGKLSNVSDKEINFTQADITDSIFIRNYFKKNNFDCVIHLAAVSSTELTYENPSRHVKTNIEATLNLMKISSQEGVKRFINASSMAVYGDPEESKVNENMPAHAKSLYALGKLMTEIYSDLDEFKNIEIINTRFFNVYGPGQDLENVKQGIVSIFAHYIFYDEPILTKGSRERFRDFVYIDDVVNALLMLLKAKKIKSKIYNVCSGQKTTIKELQDHLIQAFGKDSATYPVEVNGVTPSDQFGIYGDYSRLNEEFGWKPQTRVKDGIVRTVDWYMKNIKKTNSLS
ncbi:MAG: GDP-mannose 4,6-dehydratase [Microgenomates group bacterium]